MFARLCLCFLFFFFFNDTATTEIYTLSLHDALPIWRADRDGDQQSGNVKFQGIQSRSEEHTSELHSHSDLVCRLLLEKKKKQKKRDLLNKTNKNTQISYNHDLTR